MSIIKVYFYLYRYIYAQKYIHIFHFWWFLTCSMRKEGLSIYFQLIKRSRRTLTKYQIYIYQQQQQTNLIAQNNGHAIVFWHYVIWRRIRANFQYSVAETPQALVCTTKMIFFVMFYVLSSIVHILSYTYYFFWSEQFQTSSTFSLVPVYTKYKNYNLFWSMKFLKRYQK